MTVAKGVAASAGLLLLACGSSSRPLGLSSGARSPFASAGAEPAVTGHADFTRGTTRYRYSINAIVHSDLTVSGEFEEHIDLPSGVTQMAHATVTCVTVEPDGRTARLGGVIDRTENIVLPPGFVEGFLTVRDNGEGADDPPDQASVSGIGVAGTAEIHCTTGFNRNPGPIEHGNIQVRP
jgi:hypothetical protein